MEMRRSDKGVPIHLHVESVRIRIDTMFRPGQVGSPTGKLHPSGGESSQRSFFLLHNCDHGKKGYSQVAEKRSAAAELQS